MITAFFKYQGCEKDYYFGRDFCPLCCIKIYFWHDLGNFDEYLDRIQFNLSKLKVYIFKLYPFLMKCYHVDKGSLEAFSGHMCGRVATDTQVKKGNLLWKKLSEKELNLKNSMEKKSISSFFINIVISLFSVLVYPKLK